MGILCLLNSSRNTLLLLDIIEYCAHADCNPSGTKGGLTPSIAERVAVYCAATSCRAFTSCGNPSNLASKIAAMDAKQYDRDLVSLDAAAEVDGRSTSKSKVCQQYDVNVDVLLSEIVHTSDDIAELKTKDVSFRKVQANETEIIKLESYLSELENILDQKYQIATQLKKEKTERQRIESALMIIEPLQSAFIELQKKLQKQSGVIRQNSSLFISPDIFRSMHDLSKKSF